jgi:hypothetical protein
MLHVAVTVDVCPDANREAPGRVETVTAGTGSGVELHACRRGLGLIVELVERLELPCTFFWEGRLLAEFADSVPDLIERLAREGGHEHACHGLKHEDFAGEVSGIPLNRDDCEAVLCQASGIVKEQFAGPLPGFRAPYGRLTSPLLDALQARGFRYDATRLTFHDSNGGLAPSVLREDESRGSLWELPMCLGRDDEGETISSYLWQLFEGRPRGPIPGACSR